MTTPNLNQLYATQGVGSWNDALNTGYFMPPQQDNQYLGPGQENVTPLSICKTNCTSTYSDADRIENCKLLCGFRYGNQ